MQTFLFPEAGRKLSGIKPQRVEGSLDRRKGCWGGRLRKSKEVMYSTAAAGRETVAKLSCGTAEYSRIRTPCKPALKNSCRTKMLRREAGLDGRQRANILGIRERKRASRQGQSRRKSRPLIGLKAGKEPVHSVTARSSDKGKRKLTQETVVKSERSNTGAGASERP